MGAAMPAAARMSSTRTPSQLVSNLLHLVTQWMSRLSCGPGQGVELVPAPRGDRTRAVLEGEAPRFLRDVGRRAGGEDREAVLLVLAGGQAGRILGGEPASKESAGDQARLRFGSVVEGIGDEPPADHEGVGDETERRRVDEAAAVAEQLGEAVVDVLVFVRHVLDVERAVDLEPRAAIREA